MSTQRCTVLAHAASQSAYPTCEDAGSSRSAIGHPSLVIGGDVPRRLAGTPSFVKRELGSGRRHTIREGKLVKRGKGAPKVEEGGFIESVIKREVRRQKCRLQDCAGVGV